jgi:hypothetical protein
MNMGSYLQIRLDEAELDKIDAWRRRQQNPPTRPRAALQLVRAALGVNAETAEPANARYNSVDRCKDAKALA